MKRTINVYEFRDAFRDMGRSDNFSYEGLGVLFEYFEQLEEDCETEIELDVISICCEYNEYTIDEFFEQYDIDMDQFDDERDAIDWYLSGEGSAVGWVSIPDNGWHIVCSQF
jgi:hypothetical protein